MIAEHIETAASLVVFSDDWGRHPSSCQHLVRELLPNYKVLWVNTIGTRAPRFDRATFNRVAEKAKQWIAGSRASNSEIAPTSEDVPATDSQHPNLTVVNPRMWPWFGRPHDRRLNAWLLSQQLTPLITALPQPVCAVTTLPITADLPGRLPVSKWIYYCVDDFGEWPGLDGSTLRTMDVDMIRSADQIVTVSHHLQQLIAKQQRTSQLLTHGVNLQHWQPVPGEHTKSVLQASERQQQVVFWGVIDQRLDTSMLIALSQQMPQGEILLVGPQQDPDERILKLPNVRCAGPRPYADLPEIASRAQVLIMPYADLPVTRAMQPLKMKEYLATGKPVVVSPLPAVAEWSDCLDIAGTPEEFAQSVICRLNGMVPGAQQAARQRLQHESWPAKARVLEQFFDLNEWNDGEI